MKRGPITIRLVEPWATWLRTLAAQNHRQAPTGWVRRQVKIAAQVGRLRGALASKGRRKPHA